MPSSTSSSRRPVVAALLAFAACALLGELAYTPERGWHGELRHPIPTAEAEYIVGEAYTGHSDAYYVHFHGLGSAIDNARRADVLLLGNSRVEFAFRAPELRTFTQRTGLKVYNLAYGAGDGLPMALQTLERHDLRPRFAVVNDDAFFRPTMSSYAKDTTEAGAWQAHVRVTEHRASWALRRQLHGLLPRWDLGLLRGATPLVSYRSMLDGAFVMEAFPQDLRPLRTRDRPDAPIPPGFAQRNQAALARHTAVAGRFRDFLAARGTKLVLTVVPREGAAYTPTRVVAQRLGVPFVAPPTTKLHTIDGSHLDADSARRWATDLLAGFPPKGR